jgi:hypothetical protein
MPSHSKNDSHRLCTSGARVNVATTRKEIALGTIVADDIFSAMAREEALARLQDELNAALGTDRQTA